MKLFQLILFVLFVSCSKSEFDTKLSETGINLKFEKEFQLKSYNQFPFILIGENTKNSSQLKIQIKKVKSLDEANDEVKKAIFLTNSQYEFSLAPYPGQITDAASCGKSKKPSANKFSNINIIKKYTNSRLALSICDTDPSNFIMYTSFFYDKNSSNLIIVDYYVSNELSQPALFFKKHFNEFINLELP